MGYFKIPFCETIEADEQSISYLLMNFRIYRCVNCFGKIYPGPDKLTCGNCGAVYRVVKGIPHFFSAPLQGKASPLGLASRLFEAPLLYEWMVKLKTMVAPDQMLGIRDLTDGHSLLNIGCGSNVEDKHLEYNLHALSDFSAVDVSPSFVEAAKKNCTRKNADFCVASIDKLPYADSSFDVVLIAFVLHHLPFPFDIAIREAMRVAKRYVVIYDHVKSEDNAVVRAAQEIYWRLLDGGHQYLTAGEWTQVLRNLPVIREVRTGAIGKHVYKFVLEKKR